MRIILHPASSSFTSWSKKCLNKFSSTYPNISRNPYRAPHLQRVRHQTRFTISLNEMYKNVACIPVICRFGRPLAELVAGECWLSTNAMFIHFMGKPRKCGTVSNVVCFFIVPRIILFAFFVFYGVVNYTILLSNNLNALFFKCIHFGVILWKQKTVATA